MALPPLAELDADLVPRLGRALADAAEAALAAAALDDASDLVREATGHTFVTATGELVADLPRDARRIALAAALRVVRNPEGLVTENVDDYAYRRTDTTPGAGGGAYLTEDERRTLSGLRAGGTSGLWTLGITRDVAGLASDYRPVAGGSDMPFFAVDDPILGGIG